MVAYVIALYASSFLFDWVTYFGYLSPMAKITYNTRMEEGLIKRFKILAIQLGKRQNEVLEEAIRDLLKKHEKKSKK